MTKGLSSSPIIRVQRTGTAWFAMMFESVLLSEAFMKTSHSCKKTYNVLCLWASKRDRSVDELTGRGLARLTFQSEATVWRSLKELEELGFITRTRQTTSGGGNAVNLYTIHDDGPFPTRSEGVSDSTPCPGDALEDRSSTQGGQSAQLNQSTSSPGGGCLTGESTPCLTGESTPCLTGERTLTENREQYRDPPFVPPPDPPQPPPPQPPASGGSSKQADEEQVGFAAAVLEALDQAEPEADWWGQAAKPTTTAVDRVFTALQRAKQPSRDPLTFQRTQPAYTGNGRKRDLRTALPEAARRKLAGKLQAEQPETTAGSQEQESFESFMAGCQDLIASGLATEAQLRECWESHSTAAGAVQGHGG